LNKTSSALVKTTLPQKNHLQLRWEIERLSTFRNRWIFGRIQLKKLVKRQHQKGSISMKFIPRLYC